MILTIIYISQLYSLQPVVTVFLDLCVAVYRVIYDLRNCSVGATCERDRSRVQVQFKIKCFKLTFQRLKKTELNSSGFQTVGTLRSEEGDGRENVAEKMNSRSFDLHLDYSKSLTLSNVGELS